MIQGPRFSTRAESKWFASQGWEVINMTQYPECYLARELEICYVNISLITDYDAGMEGAEPVTNDEVVRVFNENNSKVKDLIYAMIPALPDEARVRVRARARGRGVLDRHRAAARRSAAGRLVFGGGVFDIPSFRIGTVFGIPSRST